MKIVFKILLLIIFIIPVLCFGDKPIANGLKKINYQYTVNYGKFGEGDLNGIIIKNSLNWELNHGRLSLNLNFGEGQYLRKDIYYLVRNNNVYTDFLDQQAYLYFDTKYSICPINTKLFSFYFGGGPALGYFSKKFYQFWYKENDSSPYILLMGEYLDGVSLGLSINVQLYVKAIKRFPIVFNAGYDSFFKYQSSIFYTGIGFAIN